VKRLGEPPYVCLITDGKTTPQNFESKKLETLGAIRDAVAEGVDLIQIREKALPARQLFELVSETVKVLAPFEALVIVNDRADVAVAAGADGVHLPENSVPAEVIRSAFGERFVVGASTHSIESARAAKASGADYVFFGPVFETPGKGPPVGIGALKSVCSALPSFPVIALGGVDHHNLDEVLEAGAAGIAAIRALNDGAAREAMLRRLKASSRLVR
jgi:thiamine-phosphate pyrophosphorylase